MKNKCYSIRTIYCYSIRGEATLSTIFVSRQIFRWSYITMIQLDFFLLHEFCPALITTRVAWPVFMNFAPGICFCLAIDIQNAKCWDRSNILDVEYYQISTTWLLGNQKCTELSWHFAFAMLPYFMWMIRYCHLCYSWETIWELIDIDLHDMTRKIASEFALEWSA